MKSHTRRIKYNPNKHPRRNAMRKLVIADHKSGAIDRDIAIAEQNEAAQDFLQY